MISMQSHMLAALEEQMTEWEEVLGGMTEAELLTPLTPSHWTTKDMLAHLAAWQVRSNARLESALNGDEPVFPRWLPEQDEPGGMDDTEKVNAAIYELNKDKPYLQVYSEWRQGFNRLLEQTAKLEYRALIDGDCFAWMNGYSMADVLLGTYGHHYEHMEMLREWRTKNQ